jgi:MFS family permease
VYYECEAEVICESEGQIKYYIDWEDEESLDNWVETLDLMCVPDDKVYRISSVYYLGEILGCIMIARVPDLFGRKWPLAITNAIQFPVYVSVILSRNLDFTICLAFLMGVLRIGIYNGAYINICEYVQTKWKNHVCTALLAFDMLSVILVGFYW